MITPDSPERSESFAHVSLKCSSCCLALAADRYYACQCQCQDWAHSHSATRKLPTIGNMLIDVKARPNWMPKYVNKTMQMSGGACQRRACGCLRLRIPPGSRSCLRQAAGNSGNCRCQCAFLPVRWCEPSQTSYNNKQARRCVRQLRRQLCLCLRQSWQSCGILFFLF